MQEIEFYCKKCKKSMKMSYALIGNDSALVMNGIFLRCHTNKCCRSLTLKNFTEEKVKAGADAHGKYYL